MRRKCGSIVILSASEESMVMGIEILRYAQDDKDGGLGLHIHLCQWQAISFASTAFNKKA